MKFVRLSNKGAGTLCEMLSADVRKPVVTAGVHGLQIQVLKNILINSFDLIQIYDMIFKE